MWLCLFLYFLVDEILIGIDHIYFQLSWFSVFIGANHRLVTRYKIIIKVSIWPSQNRALFLQLLTFVSVVVFPFWFFFFCFSLSRLSLLSVLSRHRLRLVLMSSGSEHQDSNAKLCADYVLPAPRNVFLALLVSVSCSLAKLRRRVVNCVLATLTHLWGG